MMVKELYDKLTIDYNKTFNSGATCGQILKYVAQYKGIVPMMVVHNALAACHIKCSLVYLHTVLETHFVCFENGGKSYIDFNSPIGIREWQD
jgi:hypothetical protein